MVDGAVVADEAGAVHAEDDRLAVEDDFLPDLVEGALREGASRSAANGRRPLLAMPAAMRGQVALADAGVEVAVGEDLFEFAQARAVGHGGGEGDDAVVALGQVDHGVGEGGRSRICRCPC